VAEVVFIANDQITADQLNIILSGLWENLNINTFLKPSEGSVVHEPDGA